jgi:hypothetical protein
VVHELHIEGQRIYDGRMFCREPELWHRLQRAIARICRRAIRRGYDRRDVAIVVHQVTAGACMDIDS